MKKKLSLRTFWERQPVLTGAVGSLLASSVLGVASLFIPPLQNFILSVVSALWSVLCAEVTLPLWAFVPILLVVPSVLGAYRWARTVRDPRDVRAILQTWADLPKTQLYKAINLPKLDRGLRLPRGSAKRFLKEIAKERDYFVKEEGPTTILFEYRNPSPPEPDRWSNLRGL